MAAENFFSLHVSIALVDNDWILSDDREKLNGMVNHIIEELMDLDMEPKPESLLYVQSRKWFDTSGGGRGTSWELPFVEVFDLLGVSVPKE